MPQLPTSPQKHATSVVTSVHMHGVSFQYGFTFPLEAHALVGATHTPYAVLRHVGSHNS